MAITPMYVFTGIETDTHYHKVVSARQYPVGTWAWYGSWYQSVQDSDYKGNPHWKLMPDTKVPAVLRTKLLLLGG